MKINKRIRIKVLKRIVKKLTKTMNSLSPYGFIDPMDYYYKIEYWEEQLKKLNNKNVR